MPSAPEEETHTDTRRTEPLVSKVRMLDSDAIGFGITQNAWQTYIQRSVNSRDNWYDHAASSTSRIYAEQFVVDSLLETRTPTYQEMIKKTAGALGAFSARQRLGIVVPMSGRSWENVPNLIFQLENQTNQSGESVRNDEWNALIVLGAPISETDGGDESLHTLIQMARQIDDFKRKYAASHERESPIDYVIAPIPAQIGITRFSSKDMARMIGADIQAARSNMRNATERAQQGGTYYLQFLDGDTTTINQTWIQDKLQLIEDDQNTHGFFRENWTYSHIDLLRYPYLNPLQEFFNKTREAVSRRTLAAWTQGRTSMFSLYEYAQAGGYLPIKIRRHGDADIRIGMSINAKRGLRPSRQGETFSGYIATDCYKELLALGKILELPEAESGTTTREMHNIITLRKSYSRIRDLLTRGVIPHEQHDAWIEDDQAFQDILHPEIIQIMTTAYTELVRTELSLDLMRQHVPIVRELYSLFTNGHIPYPMLREYFNETEHMMVATDAERTQLIRSSGLLRTLSSDQIVLEEEHQALEKFVANGEMNGNPQIYEILEQAQREAVHIMSDILTDMDVKHTRHNVNELSGIAKEDILPEHITIDDISGYRHVLQRRFDLQQENAEI